MHGSRYLEEVLVGGGGGAAAVVAAAAFWYTQEALKSATFIGLGFMV